MPSFGRNEWRAQDFQLLLTGAIHLFWRRAILDETVAELREAGYDILVLDASRWSSEGEMHSDIAREFSFPAYYGKNMDALNDCLRDVALGEENSALTSATALVLDHFDSFVRAEASAAQTFIDIFADNSRRAMLVGHRMVCLLQSDDPRLQLAPVGATPVAWNHKEWMEKNRGL
jgi:hypothetical protein